MKDSNGQRIPWGLFVSELIGTALLVLVGLSLVILMFGTGSPMASLIPGEELRSLITGFLFGTSVISGQWEGWWIYWIGPMAGMLLAVLTCSFLAKRIEVAKLYYFDSDRDRLFRRMAVPTPGGTEP